MALAENVHILTLEPWSDGTQLLRLEHVYDVGENLVIIKNLFFFFYELAKTLFSIFCAI